MDLAEITHDDKSECEFVYYVEEDNTYYFLRCRMLSDLSISGNTASLQDTHTSIDLHRPSEMNVIRFKMKLNDRTYDLEAVCHIIPLSVIVAYVNKTICNININSTKVFDVPPEGFTLDKKNNLIDRLSSNAHQVENLVHYITSSSK